MFPASVSQSINFAQAEKSSVLKLVNFSEEWFTARLCILGHRPAVKSEEEIVKSDPRFVMASFPPHLSASPPIEALSP